MKECWYHYVLYLYHLSWSFELILVMERTNSFAKRVFWIISLHYAKEKFCFSNFHSSKNLNWLNNGSVVVPRVSNEPYFNCIISLRLYLQNIEKDHLLFIGAK